MFRKMFAKQLAPALTLLLGSAPLIAGEGAPVEAPPKPNIVLILVDDLGPDLVGVYRQVLIDRVQAAPGCADNDDCHPQPAKTPTMDAMAANGKQFTRVWSNPVCSPTRAHLMTGLYGFRTGIGTIVTREPFIGIRFPSKPLPWALEEVGYTTACTGKWHLRECGDERLAQHPVLQSRGASGEFEGAGFDYYAGSLFNLKMVNQIPDCVPTDACEGYYSWAKTFSLPGADPKTLYGHPVYATVDTIEDAIGVIDPDVPLRAPLPDFQLQEPWFLYVPVNAPHGPFTLPCPNHTEEVNIHWRVRQLTEDLDRELAKLFDVIDWNDTVVFLLGDNGTHNTAITPRVLDGHGKGNIFEGGVHVPLIVRGVGIAPGTQCDALVNTTDLYATIADFAGANEHPMDSHSFLDALRNPAEFVPRRTIYAELFEPNFDATQQSFNPAMLIRHDRAIRNQRYRLIRGRGRVPSRIELFDLLLDPFEQDNLYPTITNPPVDPELLANYCELRCALAALCVDATCVDMPDLALCGECE